MEEVTREIWQHMSQEEVETICIHGIAGMGKTAIAAALNNQAVRAPDELFDFVIWVDVSNGADLGQVQEDIARSISIDLPPRSDINARAGILANALTDENSFHSNINARADKLRDALTKRRKFLLILDSMWQGYSPSRIGIPELTGGRKLIVTSRLLSVFNSFRGRKFYEIKPLTDDAATDLFVHELGSDILSKLPSETLARTKTAKQELQGISLAIKNLAETLNKIYEDPRASIVAEWTEILDCLSRSATFLHNGNPELFSTLQKSYQNLRPETKPCFLFCALYPKGHPIETKELIDYWMWEGLKSASAQMPSSQQFFVEAGNGHTTFRLAGVLPEAVVGISFMRNQLRALTLPGTYNFNMLSTLLLQDNPFNLYRHNNLFFNCMRNLKVLDLSCTNLSSLPNSLSNLTNLRALLLRNCPHLKHLPVVSNLNQLQVLDLSHAQLEQWPVGMQMLTNLRRLDLTQGKLDIFQASCVCDYRQLEELLMIGDINSRGCMWGSNKLKDWSGACVERLPDLGHLAVLELVFLNVSVFESYMKACPKSRDKYAHPTTRFKFCIGGIHTAGVDSNLYENNMTVIGDHSIMLPQSTLVLNLMKCMDDVTSLKMAGCLRDLTIIDVFALNRLTYLLTLDMLHSLGSLRKICVRRCKNMVGIIQPAKEANSRVISHSSLAELVLFGLENLESLYDRQALYCKNLTRIGVWKCRILSLPRLLGDALVPPEVSSSPRVKILDQKKPNSLHREGIISSYHPQIWLRSAGFVSGSTASNLLQSVKNAIGKTAPHMVDSVARRVFRLLNSVNRLSPRSQRNSGGI
ncbi:hypothetical protein Ancab_004908 [Ancistrocladus abbreviatus]